MHIIYMQFLAARSRWTNFISARCFIPLATSIHIWMSTDCDRFCELRVCGLSVCMCISVCVWWGGEGGEKA